MPQGRNMVFFILSGKSKSSKAQISRSIISLNEGHHLTKNGTRTEKEMFNYSVFVPLLQHPSHL